MKELKALLECVETLVFGCSLQALQALKMFQKIEAVAGEDLTSTRKLRARICAASPPLGRSTLLSLISGVLGGNFCCPQFYLKVTEQLSKQTPSWKPDGLFLFVG